MIAFHAILPQSNLIMSQLIRPLRVYEVETVSLNNETSNRRYFYESLKVALRVRLSAECDFTRKVAWCYAFFLPL
jgi:hypothetical protein